MQSQTCSQSGFTLPDISQYQRWAFTPPLHLYCVKWLLWNFACAKFLRRSSKVFVFQMLIAFKKLRTVIFISVALSSSSRTLGFPERITVQAARTFLTIQTRLSHPIPTAQSPADFFTILTQKPLKINIFLWLFNLLFLW